MKLDERIKCLACSQVMKTENASQLHARCKKTACVKCKKQFTWTNKERIRCADCERDYRRGQRRAGNGIGDCLEMT